MRIIFLAPRLPIPADTGGKIRTYNILKQLAKTNDIHLVCFSFETADNDLAAGLKKKGMDVTLVPMQEPDVAAKIFGVLFSLMPFSMSKYLSPQMKMVLTSLCGSGKFDAVHVDHLHMAHYRGCFEGLPCVMDEHNVEYRILERCADVEKSPLKKFIFRNQASKMKDFETQRVGEFTQVLAVSQDDHDILKEISRSATPVAVIPNGVDTEFFQSDPNAAKEDSLVFTGSMDWLPNEDAVIYFCQEILPLIWEARSGVKFYVVGKGATPAITDLSEKDPRIVVTGRVEDVRPFMDKSGVFVVPIRVGGGTRLKILEAMSMEKAVVSTTVGAEGIKHTNGKDILLADTPQEFAKQVLFLLGNASKAKEIGREARKLVCGEYDWNIVGRKLNTIYAQISNKK